MSDMSFIHAVSEFGFMRRSLIACLALSLSLTPLGVFMQLRRMSMVGDALSHAVLPGVAIGYLLSGMSLLAMGLGGFIAGLVVAITAGWLSAKTHLSEDATVTGLYLGSLAAGVTLVSMHSTGIDLLHLLFGSMLAVDNRSLLFIGAISSCTLLVLAFSYRAIVIEAFDSLFLRVQKPQMADGIHALFMALMVMNLVAGFQILGTLMTVGLMMLPAIASRCWSKHLPWLFLLAILFALLSSLIGLMGSWYASLPAGPAIILAAFVIFLVSLLFGRQSGIIYTLSARHASHI